MKIVLRGIVAAAFMLVMSGSVQAHPIIFFTGDHHSDHHVTSHGCNVADPDGDLVTESHDFCANTSSLAAVNCMGCDLDTDGDSVANHNDDCEGTPKGSTVDSKGCLVDADIDGVIDVTEPIKCLGTPYGELVDSKGCIIPPLTTVHFPTGKHGLSAAAKAKLHKSVVLPMKIYLGMMANVQGHTDWQVTDRYHRGRNVALSERRANEVKSYLTSKGIHADRIVTAGYGDSRPRYFNSMPLGQSKNRRVDVHIIRNLDNIVDGPTARKLDSVR